MSEPSEKKQKQQDEKTLRQKCQEGGRNLLIRLMYDKVAAMGALPYEMLDMIADYDDPDHFMEEHGCVISKYENGVYEARSRSGLVHIIGQARVTDREGVQFTNATVTRAAEDHDPDTCKLFRRPVQSAFIASRVDGLTNFLPFGTFFYNCYARSFCATCRPGANFENAESDTFEAQGDFDGPDRYGIMECNSGKFIRSERNELMEGRFTTIRDESKQTYDAPTWTLCERRGKLGGINTTVSVVLDTLSPFPFCPLLKVRDLRLAQQSMVLIQSGDGDEDRHKLQLAHAVIFDAHPSHFDARWIVEIKSTLIGEQFGFEYQTAALEWAPERVEQIIRARIKEMDVDSNIALAFIRQLYGVPFDEDHEMLLQSPKLRLLCKNVISALRIINGKYFTAPYALH